MASRLTGFGSHGIREPLTNRIAGILDEYPDGTQIARELLQNSDDARSTVQWYLLDHRNHLHYPSTPGQGAKNSLRLFHEDLEEYMGPALLAGNDSLFEEKDFLSMKNLAASEKKADVTKIGQMGIGFNSIYHLTDCPSFISGDQFMVIEPHERIFNGIRSEFREGAVKGNYVEGCQGLELFPDQLKTFSVVEDIDFSKPYPGTVFRFPLRTKAQAETSKLSQYAYPTDKVLEMLLKLKQEALKGMLFLKHLERIVIYERKETDVAPVKLFEIEIVNAKEVREERLRVVNNLKEHVHPKDPDNANKDATLQYTVCPKFRLTQGDGSTVEEQWQITGLVGNVLQAKEEMGKQTDGDLANHKLIPWVGIAAPLDADATIDNSGLFCFLPISIQLPFPVHINGHFAVKHSRREIWTNQDQDFGSQASANIKSLWNVHLFHKHIPQVYAMFLERLGLHRGSSYDMWPLSCGDGVGLEAIWKDVLERLVEVVLAKDSRVFVCGTKVRGEQRMVSYSSSWIAGPDMDEYPLLVDSLQEVTNLVAGLPDAILETIPNVRDTLEMENRILTPASVRDLLRDHKSEWQRTASTETRIQMLNYCLRDEGFEDLEGLPLLPLVGNLWVEFNKECSSTRHLVLSRTLFSVLKYSPDGIVDMSVRGLPLETFKDDRFKVFWSKITSKAVIFRIKDMFDRLCYKGETIPTGCITQIKGGFPTDSWLADFWKMSNADSSPCTLPKGLEGYHLLPILEGQIAPLSTESFVISNWGNSGTEALRAFSTVLGGLGCRLLRDLDSFPEEVASQYLVELNKADRILSILSKLQTECLRSMSQDQCRTVNQYMAEWLPHDVALDQEQLRVMRALPIYLDYRETAYMSLDVCGDEEDSLQVANKFSHSEKPWLPASVRLLAHEQLMQKHLVGLLGVPVMKESAYWFHVTSHLGEHSKDDWDDIMAAFCAGYHAHCKDFSFKTVLADIPFVRVKGPYSDMIGGFLKAPRSTVDPSLSCFFLHDEIVFPGGVYATAPISTALPYLGMQTAFDAEFVAGRIRVLSDPDLVDEIEQRNGALLALYKRLDADCTQELLTRSLQNVLQTTPWILAKTITDGGEAQLYTPSQCRPASERPLLGSQLPLSTFTFTNTALLKCMGWNSPPPLDKVLANLVSIIEQATSGKSTDGRPAVDDMVILAIYRYLLEQVSDPEALLTAKAALKSYPWILINGILHTADRVALKMTCDLSPHYVQITPSKMDDLFLAMGVREHVRQEDLQEIIETVASKYSEDESLSNVDVELVVKLLDSIASGPSFQWSPELLVLTEHRQLRKITGVVFDDAKARQSSSEGWEAESTEMPYTFASNRISRFVAEKLQINMLSAQCWQMDSTFETWAQQEDIVDRIRNVLNDYDPSSILTEFLQNAADAGATKCVFMLDYKSYGTEKVLSKEMAAWQGPALMIYNNAEFSQDDFRALSQLGVGNKRDDSSKIGRHGLGFNSVYHFGDVPSVCSGSYIGFFDPLLTNLPKIRTASGLVAQGGQRCDFRKLKHDALSDQLAPYENAFGCDMKSRFKGTIFRIPLRTLDSQLKAKSASRISDNVWTIPQMHELLTSWFENAKLSMLFLDKMMEVEIMASEAFIWSASKSSVIKEFGMERSLIRQEDSLALTDIIRIEVKTAKVEAGRVDSASSSGSTQDWLLRIEEGFPLYASAAVKVLAKKHHWSTHRGVAIPLFSKKSRASVVQGRLFAHLPTPIVTQLHFHIHGMFALMSNRKSLAGGSEEGNPMTLWNAFILAECLPLTAVNAHVSLLQWCFRSPKHGGPAKQIDLDYANNLYFDYVPKTVHKDMERFLQNFWKQSHQHPIFPCLTNDKVKPVVGLKGAVAVFPSNSSAPGELDLKMRAWFRSLGILYCDCPRTVLAHILPADKGKFGHVVQQVDEDMMRKLIKKDPSFIPQQIKTETGKQWILEYVLRAVLDKSPPLEPISGLAILPLVNGEWKQLLPSPLYYTASSDMRSFINGGDLLVDETLFSTEVLQKILTKLTTDGIYGVERLPASVFAEAYEKEHPNGVSPESWENLWVYLKQFPDLELFEDMSILKTADGTMRPLRDFRDALRISSASYDDGKMVQDLKSLLADLGIAVFDAQLHKNHTYLINNVPMCSPERVLTLLSHWSSSWPMTRAITNNEAQVLRQALYNLHDYRMDEQVLHDLGYLKIWNSYGSKAGGHRPLIQAHGSVFIVGHFDLTNLGNHEDVISNPYCSHFEALGAHSLSLAVATESRILPKLQRGALKSTADTRAAYSRLLSEIVRLATQGTKKANREAKKILKQGRIVLCRDGTLRPSVELFDAGEDLLRKIFNNAPAKFADTNAWEDIIGPVKHLFSFRNTSDKNVVLECAEEVLREISAQASTDVSGQALPMLRAKASALVSHIYSHPQGVEWMDPKWCIVPADVVSALPHGAHAPRLPKYLPFSKLVLSSYRDAVWTQCAFFPESLQPSEQFMRQFTTVGQPSVQDVVNHLTVLVRDLAPQWTSMDRLLALKTSIFKVYKTLQEMSTRSDQWKAHVGNFLKTIQVPYILNGDKEPDKEDSWLLPSQLMLGIENTIGRHQVVHPLLLPYRDFLLAAGVEQMHTVEGFVAVPVGRGVGDLEKQLLDSFEEQNRYTGFMDVRFKFADSQEIQAHKLVLVLSSDHFKRRFTGLWADYTTREEEEPGVEVINLTGQNESYEAFWGLVYYFYSDKLIATNGPAHDSKDSTRALGAGQAKEEQETTDELRDRVQYLMALQHLADLYVVPRLKSLIASEIVSGRKVTYSNAFSVRDHAILNQCKDLQDHCEKFIRTNRSSVRKHINDELVDARGRLDELSGDDHGAERAELKDEIAASERYLKELEVLT